MKIPKKIDNEFKNLYKELFDESPLCKWICDPETLKFREVNEAAIKHYGYSREEFLKLSAFDLRPENDHIKLEEFIRNQNYTDISDGSHSHIRKNGEIIEVEVALDYLIYHGKEAILAVAIDVTEKLRVNQSILDSESLYRSLFNNSPTFMWVTEVPSLKYLDVNETAIAQYGYSKEEFLSMTAFDLVPEYDRNTLKKNVQGFTGQYSGVNRHLKKNGDMIFVEIKVHRLKLKGRIVALVIGVDVTEKLRAEEKLRNSEVRFRALIENSTDGIALHLPYGKLVYITPSVERILGYRLDEVTNADPRSFIHPDDSEYLNTLVKELMPHFGESRKATYRMRHKNGSWCWLSATITNMMHLPEVQSLVFNYVDITEKKLAEEKLMTSQANLRAMLDTTNTGFYLMDKDFRIIEFNQLSYDWVLEETGKILKKDTLFSEYVLDSRKETLQFMYEQVLLGEEVYIELQGYKDRWYHVNMKRIVGKDNQVYGLCVSSTDITGQKKANERIRDSEEFYRFLFTNSPIPAWIADSKTLQFLEVNNATIEKYGYTNEEFLSMTAFDIRLQEDQQALDEFLRFEPADQVGAFSRRHVKKNGDFLFVETHARNLRYKGQNAFLVLVNDVTEAVKLNDQLVEEKIRKQIDITLATIRGQEKERNELGKELHDNVNQILATVKLYLDSALEDEKGRTKFIESGVKLVNKCIQEIRLVSKALVHPSLGDTSLEEALNELLQPIKLTGKKIRLEINGFDEVNVPDDLKISLYRIVQEQVNNIIKHAAATDVSIRLQQNHENIDLVITDNGIGFDVNKKRNGIGITNMINRASIFNGKVHINSSPGNGCVVNVHFGLDVTGEGDLRNSMSQSIEKNKDI